jgi:hypothetical protein
MLLRSCKTLFATVSLLAIVGCRGTGPLVDICIIDSFHGLQCVDKTGNNYSLPFSQSENFVCMPPSDFEAFTNWAKRKCDLD